MKTDDLLAELERLRVGFGRHHDVTYSLGATTALDEVANWIRRAARPVGEEKPIRAPWTYVALGDHAPGGRRPIYFHARGAAAAAVIAETIEASHTHDVVAGMIAAYNEKRNVEEAKDGD